MKIKPEDLRIGNLIRLEHSIMRMQVKEIRTSEHNTFLSLILHGGIDKPNNRFDEAIDGLAGIEITAEMLHRLGFTYNEKRNNWFIDYSTDVTSRIFVVREDVKDNLGWFCYIHDLVTFDSVNLCLLPALHLLQNAFYCATGKELEVKL